MRALGYRGLIVGLTGQMDPACIQEFVDCGANEVVGKPCDVELIKSILNRCLEEKVAAKGAAVAPPRVAEAEGSSPSAP